VPSKKVLLLAIACTVALLCIIVAFAYTPKTTKVAETVPVVSVQSQTNLLQTQFSEKDSDNDGLKDWEETLWGTDPMKSDTDGDGTKDGDEVKAGRSPTNKGTNDKITSQDLPVALQASTTKAATTTPTTVFAQELFSRYMSLKQSGENVTPEMQADLISQILLEHNAQSSDAPVYTTRDFKVASSETLDSVRAYGNAMGSILKNDAPKIDMPELALVELAVENSDPSKLEKIGIMVEAYQKMLAKMKALTVPPSAASLHAAVMTSLGGVIYSDQAMQKYFSDPITAMIGLQQYQQTANDTIDTFASVESYFDNSGITFSPSEPGYTFTHSFK
jgi:hypothetical protein